MAKIFVTSRKIDAYDSNQLSNYLKREFGEREVFSHISGADEKVPLMPDLKKAIEDAQIFFIIIGPTWLHLQDPESGKRKIDLKADPIRNILLTIFERVNVLESATVLPVLVANATQPAPKYLDEELQPLFDYPFHHIKNPEKVGEFSVIRSVLFGTKLFKSALPPVITPVMTKLPAELGVEEELSFLEEYDQWVIQENLIPNSPNQTMRELYRFYEFLNYEDAFKFMKLVDEHGIRPHNHHPRIQNTYNRVEIWLCTFNIGYQITYRDIRLAKICEAIFENYMDIDSPFTT